jgi:hypothetical protein
MDFLPGCLATRLVLHGLTAAYTSAYSQGSARTRNWITIGCSLVAVYVRAWLRWMARQYKWRWTVVEVAPMRAELPRNNAPAASRHCCSYDFIHDTLLDETAIITCCLTSLTVDTALFFGEYISAEICPLSIRALRTRLPAMSKLSPTLKSLINAAHSRPGPVPAPPRIQAVYQRIQEEATERKLGRPSWLGISTAATMTMNSPESMIALYNSTSASRPQSEGVAIAEFMREIGLKCIGFNGVCTTLISTKAHLLTSPDSTNNQHAQRLSRRAPLINRILPQHQTVAQSRCLKYRVNKYTRPRTLGCYLPPSRDQTHT